MFNLEKEKMQNELLREEEIFGFGQQEQNGNLGWRKDTDYAFTETKASNTKFTEGNMKKNQSAYVEKRPC